LDTQALPLNGVVTIAMSASHHQPHQIELGRPTGKAAAHRVDKIRTRLELGGVWLDFGCGAGDYALLLAKYGCQKVIGVDVRENPSWAHNTDSRLQFVQTRSTVLPFPSASFAGVLMNEVLEHVADEQVVLREVRRVLTARGRLVVFSPNRWFPFEGHGARIRGRVIDRPVPLLPWLPKRLGNRWMRARNYWPHELRGLLTSSGFRVLEQGFAFPLFQEYPWLPPRLAAWARGLAPRLEETFGVRRFGVSTMLIAEPDDP
jgi:SAM-dependent methyltransferase